jgi:hypothetical protein
MTMAGKPPRDSGFGGYSQQERSLWVRGLRYFRACLAFGGHANDADRFLVALHFQGPDERERILRGLGWDRTGNTGTLNGVVLGVASTANAIELSVCGRGKDPYVLSRADFLAAASAEAALDAFAGFVADPPVLDAARCFCPRYFPGAWRKYGALRR